MLPEFEGKLPNFPAPHGVRENRIMIIKASIPGGGTKTKLLLIDQDGNTAQPQSGEIMSLVIQAGVWIHNKCHDLYDRQGSKDKELRQLLDSTHETLMTWDND